mmetsp:Transcript_747/g.1991  ORF Transcript_747/g.1991 Transcript_747/m.1991 type:complete len:226 (+) Transcript_747:370-1047(+)
MPEHPIAALPSSPSHCVETRTGGAPRHPNATGETLLIRFDRFDRFDGFEDVTADFAAQLARSVAGWPCGWVKTCAPEEKCCMNRSSLETQLSEPQARTRCPECCGHVRDSVVERYSHRHCALQFEKQTRTSEPRRRRGLAAAAPKVCMHTSQHNPTQLLRAHERRPQIVRVAGGAWPSGASFRPRENVLRRHIQKHRCHSRQVQKSVHSSPIGSGRSPPTQHTRC